MNPEMHTTLLNTYPLTGRLTGVHKVLRSAAEISCKGRQDFYLGHDGGYMIPIYSKIGQETRNHFEKLVNWYGKKELIPVYLENNIFNFHLNREVKSTENQQSERLLSISRDPSEELSMTVGKRAIGRSSCSSSTPMGQL